MASRMHLILCEAIGLTIFIFALLVWGYVVIINVTHPEWVREAFSRHNIPPFDWPVDDVGIVSFAIAPIGFLMWYLSRASLTIPERSRRK